MTDPALIRLRRELWHARNVHEDQYAALLEAEIAKIEPVRETRVPSAKNPGMERASEPPLAAANSLGSAASGNSARRKKGEQ